MRSKKGVVEIQFNWMFVLIAGAVILALFIGIILRQKGISETSTNALVLNNLDGIISGSEASVGTVNVVKIPEAKIEFGCNSYAVMEASKQLNAMNVFTPSVLEGNSLITMTLDWSIPYRVTNLVYLTNSRMRYVFVADTNNEFANKIFKMIPDEINKDKDIYGNVNEIVDKKDDKVRIIFFGQNPVFPGNLKGMESGTVTALKVEGDEGIGTLEFYSFDGNAFISKGTSYYVKEPTLLGAIFTDDFGIYNCVMNTAFKKLNIVSQIYLEKTNNLKKYYEKSNSCKDPNSRTPIHHDANIRIILESSNTFIQSSIGSILTASKNLEIQNKNAKEKSCALIY